MCATMALPLAFVLSCELMLFRLLIVVHDVNSWWRRPFYHHQFCHLRFVVDKVLLGNSEAIDDDEENNQRDHLAVL